MSVEAIMWAKRTSAGSPAKKLLLLILADYADERWSCFPGQVLLAQQSEMGERTVRRLLAEMETDGLFRREHRQRQDGSRTSDRFVLAGAGAQDPTGQPRQPTGQPRQSNRPAVAGHEPTGDPQEEPTGPPTPHDVGQLSLVGDTSPPADRERLTLIGFDAFWRVYPRREGKGAARKAWARAIRRARAEDIIAGAQRYGADPNRVDQFTAHASTWLNAERWTDEPLPARTAGPGRRSSTAGTMDAARALLASGAHRQATAPALETGA